jgi:hypothetical protein
MEQTASWKLSRAQLASKILAFCGTCYLVHKSLSLVSNPDANKFSHNPTSCLHQIQFTTNLHSTPIISMQSDPRGVHKSILHAILFPPFPTNIILLGWSVTVMIGGGRRLCKIFIISIYPASCYSLETNILSVPCAGTHCIYNRRSKQLNIYAIVF